MCAHVQIHGSHPVPRPVVNRSLELPPVLLSTRTYPEVPHCPFSLIQHKRMLNRVMRMCQLEGGTFYQCKTSAFITTVDELMLDESWSCPCSFLLLWLFFLTTVQSCTYLMLTLILATSDIEMLIWLIMLFLSCPCSRSI